MNTFLQKLRDAWNGPVMKKALLLTGCAVLAVGGGVGAAFAYHAAQTAQPTSVPVSSSSVSVTVSRRPVVTTSYTSSMDTSSDSLEEEKQPVKLSLVITSATQDLNINIVDEAGARVRDVPFMLRLTGQDKENADYDKLFEVDSNYGSLYLSWIPAGNYIAELEEAEGFTVPEPTKFNVKEFKVTYTKIDNIADQIVDEKDVDVSKDDNSFNGGDNSGADTNDPPPTAQDTVAFVESSKKEVQEPLKDEKGNFLYTYTYEVGPGGRLLLTVGGESDVEPVVKDSVLVYGMRYTKTGSTADAAQALHMGWGTVRDEDTPSESGSSSSETAPSTSSEAPSDSTPESFTVTFVNPDGAVLSTVPVTAGGTATPPADPTFAGGDKRYVFTGWSAPYDNVRQNLTITAVYDIYTPEQVTLFRADNTPDPTYKIAAVKRTKTVYLYTGWQTIDGKTYYYTADNKKVTGWQVIQGISYFFNSDGVRSDCMGIDVSRWNNSIDWAAVKAAGIDFAIIRVGYRGYGTGKLVEDPLARQNLAGATAAGIKVGVYVFSQAINQEEAVEEASMALEIVKGYSLAYPIFIDSEYSTSAKDGRADALSAAQRTAICAAFCKTVANSGYRTGVYASKSWFQYQLNVGGLEQYHIWLAHYTTATDYARRYDLWQYTSTATVPGIRGSVDMNFSYLNY